MNISAFAPEELIGILVGLFLTLCVFSYIFGDNVLFRLAIHIFIGVASGYLGIILLLNVIWPKVIQPIVTWDNQSSNLILLLIPFLLSLLLLTKLIPRLTPVGSPIMAYLVGIGAAIAIGGALMGTLIPQVLATINLFDTQGTNQPDNVFLIFIIESIFILVGTLSTIIYFHFGARSSDGEVFYRSPFIESIANIGKFFIATTFGVLFANVLIASLSILASHWYQITSFILSIIRS